MLCRDEDEVRQKAKELGLVEGIVDQAMAAKVRPAVLGPQTQARTISCIAPCIAADVDCALPSDKNCIGRVAAAIAGVSARPAPAPLTRHRRSSARRYDHQSSPAYFRQP